MLGDVVALLSVLLASAALVATWHLETRSRDVATVIELGREYRHEWEGRWCDAVESAEAANRTNEVEAVLLTALNWLDWLGILIRDRALRSPQLIFDTVGPSMARIIRAGEERLVADGEAQWQGIEEIRTRLSSQGFFAA